MTDGELARFIAEHQLEEVYVRELMASLGYDPVEGWTAASIAAFEIATPAQRRRAALRTVGKSSDGL